MARLNQLAIAARYQWKDFLHKEDGDTNFISIIILLAIAVIVAGVFIAFKDQILGWATNIINKVTTGFGGTGE